jgi:DNA primase
LRLLAERAGIELRSEGPRRHEIKTLQDANEAAALYFHGLLQNNSRARAYLEARGLDNKAVSDFLLGYAPAGWESLRNHLVGRGFTEERLLEAGLLVEGERGAYDRFRDRLVFPIRDDRGRVVGLGGRMLPDPSPEGPAHAEQGPKYLNTPQTPVFDKSAILYGLDRAKDSIRQAGSAVVVEGYMDVIAAHQFGVRNVVASMGTSLTEKQAGLVQRFAERVVLAMDADEAGRAANLRAIQVVAAVPGRERPAVGGRPRTLDVRVVALPKGKDPDELIRADIGSWRDAVESARPVVDHLIAVVSAGLDLSQPRDRSTLVGEVLPAIGEIKDPVLRAHYLQRLSRLARVSEDALRRELPRRPRGRPNAESGETSAPSVPAQRGTRPSSREVFCLALLHHFPALTDSGGGLPEDLFEMSENRELFQRWKAGESVSEDESELWEHYQAVLTVRLPFTETTEAQAAFSDCVRRLQHARIRAVKEASALALAEGEAGVRPGQVASVARARLGADTAEENVEDWQVESVASQLLEDMEAGLRFHRRLIEGFRPDPSSPHIQH